MADNDWFSGLMDWARGSDAPAEDPHPTVTAGLAADAARRGQGEVRPTRFQRGEIASADSGEAEARQRRRIQEVRDFEAGVTDPEAAARIRARNEAAKAALSLKQNEGPPRPASADEPYAHMTKEEFAKYFDDKAAASQQKSDDVRRFRGTLSGKTDYGTYKRDTPDDQQRVAYEWIRSQYADPRARPEEGMPMQAASAQPAAADASPGLADLARIKTMAALAYLRGGK